MKITAVGANRTVYRHTVVNENISKTSTKNGKICFNLLSEYDPGISSGQYTLTFELNKSEVFELFDASMNIFSSTKIETLENDVKKLKKQLKEID